MFVPGNFMSLAVLSKYGFKKCIQIGGVFLIIGIWFRMLVCINNNFYFVLIGHIIASISQAFIQNPVAKMAITWFGDKERG
jgi:FtsH-binding integral membrane protein